MAQGLTGNWNPERKLWPRFRLVSEILDMQGFTFDGTETRPEGIPFFEWTLVLDGTTRFIQDHGLDVFNPPPSAGWVVTHNGNEPTQNLSTYTPTDAESVIIPNCTNPGAALSSSP
jgi:hypothetical protein